MLADGGAKSEEEGRLASAIEAGVSLLLEQIKGLMGVLAVGDFIGEVVGNAAEGVDVAEILAEVLGEEEGDDGEVFVMGMREAAGVRRRRPFVRGGREGGFSGLCRVGEYAGVCVHGLPVCCCTTLPWPVCQAIIRYRIFARDTTDGEHR